MASRFATFEALTLPSIRAQTDPDFTFLIVVGEDLPEPYANRLFALASDIPQITLQAHPPGPHRQTMRNAINAVRHKSADPCLQFRLDDDDAVSVRFVERLREMADKARPLLEGNRSLALDFNQGYIIQPGQNNIQAAQVQINYWSPALAIMFPPTVKQSVMNFSHHRVSKVMPTVTSTGEDMFLRGFTAYNDSRQNEGAKAFELTPVSAELSIHLQAMFNVDTKHLQNLMSAAQ